MGITFYKIARLIADAKAIVRGGPARGIATEPGTDTDLLMNAAARMLHGAQVSAAHIYQQLDPDTSDATRRDSLADAYGLVFERDATPARGLMAIVFDVDTVGSFVLPAGTLVELPGSLFGDGVARTYKTLEDVNHYGWFTVGTPPFGVGSSARKLRPANENGVSLMRTRDLLRVTSNDGDATWYVAARRCNVEDQSIDLINPLSGAFEVTANEKLAGFAHNVVVEVECVTAGAVGNAPAVRYDELTLGQSLPVLVYLLEAGGGGEAVGPMDGDTARVKRLIADTIACPPGFANAQHLRELALSCPDVDLDDAIVYRGVRGAGTADIVCIGRSGSVRSSAFPDANLSFCSWGNNARRIGDAQAERVQAWVTSQLGYFEDVLVRSVEWDWRGSAYAAPTSASFLQAINAVSVDVVALDGYGPDCGTALDVIPATLSSSQLLAAVANDPIDTNLRPGQRVWVTVGHKLSAGRLAYATVVTEILSLDSGGLYATVADVTALGPGPDALDGSDLVILRWGSAGRLTQGVLDAVFAYYDQLGPGTYTVAPFGPGFAKYFQPTIFTQVPGVGESRWPPEGRSWASGVRSSELRAALMAVEGVASVEIHAADGNGQLLDYDPMVFQTCALSGAIVRYTS
jgi:hypothetical protein